jgi:nitrous oxidase accessory protein NosD
MLLSLCLGLFAQGLPEIILRSDDTLVTSSCRITIPEGLVIEDRNENGVIQIHGDHILVVFTAGSILRGASAETPGDQLVGTGVRVEYSRDVTVRGLRAQGFRCGLHASYSDQLQIAGAELRNNFRQRLRSTPEAEDTIDWLSPHDNDQQQWLQRYGAGIYIDHSRDVVIQNVTIREQQNGIILDQVNHSRVFDNDCSFLSGWGLAMWRSSTNVISRNAFDFCIRGYSHGVYNRGQDSAGILLFEQCSGNVFAENSATHGGDGLFGFAGREALGQIAAEVNNFNYQRAGCNDNLFLRNDFSYAAAHGLELTFSFGNIMRGNRFVGNAICGIWGGFSQSTLIRNNHFEANGDRGYGLERGGINIDHSRENIITNNTFKQNECGVHLWSLPTDFEQSVWGKSNSLVASGNQVYANRFQGDRTAVHLRGQVGLEMWGNQVPGVGKVLDVEQPSLVGLPTKAHSTVWPESEPPIFGGQRPVGKRSHLAGRDKIIMTQWGPWDHQSALLRPWQRQADQHIFRIEPTGVAVKLLPETSSGLPAELFEQDGRQFMRVRAEQPGYHTYLSKVLLNGVEHTVSGNFLRTDWKVRFFDFAGDPREDLEGYHLAAASDQAIEVHRSDLVLPYGSGGPSSLPGMVELGSLGRDQFGTQAHTRLTLPAGKWMIRTLSDDGVRVQVNGSTVIDNWTWHAPTRDEGAFELEQDTEIEILVEHFELNGYAVLELELEAVS